VPGRPILSGEPGKFGGGFEFRPTIDRNARSPPRRIRRQERADVRNIFWLADSFSWSNTCYYVVKHLLLNVMKSGVYPAAFSFAINIASFSIPT
jgi:hypothetical protein